MTRNASATEEVRFNSAVEKSVQEEDTLGRRHYPFRPKTLVGTTLVGSRDQAYELLW